MKKIKVFLLFSLLIGVFSGFSQVNLDSALVGYWPFSGNANDVSSGGHNGTVYGATLTTDRFGNSNAAYHFNGTSNYIYITHSTLISSNQLTISVWAKGIGQQNGGLVQTGNQNAYGIGYALMDSVRFFVYTNTLGCSNFIYTPLTNAGNWNNYILTYNGSYLKFYVNGLLVKTLPYSGNIWTSQSSDLTFGVYFSYGNPYDAYFNGDIDDIRIYSRAINTDEINAIVNGNLCYQTITVTDTLIIHANLTGYNPVSYANTIKIYPNPTNDHIIIDFGSNYSSLNGYSLKITNSLGQTVYLTSINQQQTSVDLNTWTGHGVYFVYLIDGNSNTIDVRKIVLQ